MAKTTVTNGQFNIEVSLWDHDGVIKIGGSSISLGFDCDGARYHVWLDKHGEMREPLYKNPPRNIEYKKEGWFKTRELDLAAQSSQKLLKAALAQAGNFRAAYAAAYKAGEDKLAAEKAANAEASRIALVKEAGPALLPSLIDVLALARVKFGNLDPDANIVFERAEAAIIQAGGAAAADPWHPIETEPKKGMYLIKNGKGEVCPIQWPHGGHHGIVQNMPGYQDWTYGEPATGWLPLPKANTGDQS